MIKKLCLLSFLATSIHNLQAQAVNNLQEMEAPLPWNQEQKKEQINNRRKLQRRDSFQALKQAREDAGYVREVRGQRANDIYKYADMSDIQKAGESSQKMLNMFKETRSDRRHFDEKAERHAQELKNFKNNHDYQQLEGLRAERQDFDQDASIKTSRMDDVKSPNSAATIMANELRSADKYIAYLQNQVKDLQKKLEEKEKMKISSEDVSPVDLAGLNTDVPIQPTDKAIDSLTQNPSGR